VGRRILFTFAGGSGHAEPLVPLAAAARSAGHAVLFAGRPSVVEELGARGFAVVPDPASAVRVPSGIQPLAAIDLARERRAVRDGFAGRVARARAASVTALCADWRPDLLVCDDLDLGAMTAAAARGMPHATVEVSAPGFVDPDELAATVDELRATYALPPDPALAEPARHLLLSPFPPSYRATALPPTGRSLRPGGALPRAAPRSSARPTLLVTLGTVFPLESGDLIPRLLAALRTLPVDAVVVVGRDLDPARFGEQPPGIAIRRHLPLGEVLPRCDAVVSHGGGGTVLATLAHGLPSVLLPLGADQPLHAERCAALGVAMALDAATATPAVIGAAIRDVLRVASYRAAASRLREEIAALPAPEDVLPLVAAL
jgi:UDP:flavonoid glycosyltransferase YjiC (YdhE family)